MALTLKKKGPSGNGTANAKAQAKATSGGFGGGWLKRGQAAHKALASEDARAEKARAEAGKMWPFWMPPDQERTITFLDGRVRNDMSASSSAPPKTLQDENTRSFPIAITSSRKSAMA